MALADGPEKKKKEEEATQYYKTHATIVLAILPFSFLGLYQV